jgi:hypothetical protein
MSLSIFLCHLYFSTTPGTFLSRYIPSLSLRMELIKNAFLFQGFFSFLLRYCGYQRIILYHVSDPCFYSQSIPCWSLSINFSKTVQHVLPFLSVAFSTLFSNTGFQKLLLGSLSLQYSQSMCSVKGYVSHKTFYKLFPDIQAYSLWSKKYFSFYNMFVCLYSYGFSTRSRNVYSVHGARNNANAYPFDPNVLGWVKEVCNAYIFVCLLSRFFLYSSKR